MLVVTGLPRSGSMSIYRALEILGYNTLFYCPLINSGTDWVNLNTKEIKKYDAIVDWSISGALEPFVNSFNVDRVILLKRLIGWETSLENFNKLHKRVNYVYDYISASDYLINNFPKIPFLVLDIVKNPRWDDLCRFLDKPIPDLSFPHLNKSEFNYKI